MIISMKKMYGTYFSVLLKNKRKLIRKLICLMRLHNLILTSTKSKC